MKVLILGASGMLGSALTRVLNESADIEVFGTVRDQNLKQFFPKEIADNFITDCDVLSDETLNNMFSEVQPDVVVNCISLNKKMLVKAEPLQMIPIYALLPHRLAVQCEKLGARLVHMSTDGVFSGDQGGYAEDDPVDAQDIYGCTKYLGEVNKPNVINIRTSIIGHELNSANGLVEWFLSESDSCSCYSRAIFSGFPTVVLARIIRDVILPRLDLSGVYHVASEPISKCELLRLIAQTYGKSIKITENDQVVIDRSLNAERFNLATGYIPPAWPEMIKEMYLYENKDH